MRRNENHNLLKTRILESHSELPAPCGARRTLGIQLVVNKQVSECHVRLWRPISSSLPLAHRDRVRDGHAGARRCAAHLPQRHAVESSRPGRAARGRPPAARPLSRAGICRCRWAHVLWAERARELSPRRHIRGQDPERGQPPLICRSSSRRHLSWSLTSRLPKSWASRFPRRSSFRPTR
jgi:hypothetical protein